MFTDLWMGKFLLSDATSLTYAIADLHGRYDLLTAALEAIETYHRSHSAGAGTIVFLGDYVDRGPQSRQVVEHLILGPEPPWRWICLRGNHEELMLDALCLGVDDDWLANGGAYTLLSYGAGRDDEVDLSVVPADHIEWLSSLPMMHVDRHRIFVHAGVDPDRPLEDQDPSVLTWKRYPPHDWRGHGGRHVVHGHDQAIANPTSRDSRTNLDTVAWRTGRLAVAVFENEQPGGPTDLLEVSRPGVRTGGRARGATEHR